MNRLIASLASTLILHLPCLAGLTIDYCFSKAEENYPLIGKYALIESTADLQLSDINKSWLPRVELYGQTTAQNIVPEFPGTLQNVLSQMGQNIKGLGNIQYKVGVDITQTIWDGGASKAQRHIERISSAEQQAALAVQMYAVRERVINLFFGILLMDEQIAQTENSMALLKANHALMKSMLAGGVATSSDVDMIEAQLLCTAQQLVNARSAEQSYRDMLSIYIGENIDGRELIRPEAEMPSDFESDRPELRLFDAQNRLNSARDNAIKASVMPRLGFFAQAYYGYPGLNYFESMINRDLSFNLIAGIKLSWNIDSFYTKRNSHRKLALTEQNITTDRDLFLFNSRLSTASETKAIEGLKAAMSDDSRIVALRGNVRQAAESQLKNGVIDATSLLSKITDENQARLNAIYHEIQLMQNIYKLKHTLNQ